MQSGEERSAVGTRKPSRRVAKLAAVLAVVGGTTAGITLTGALSAGATVPSWPSSQYMGVLQNVPFTIPIAISGGTLPLTSMTVSSAPSNVTGFQLTNVNLSNGTADMVGTDTAGAGPGGASTAQITASNSSGSTNGTFEIEVYACTWNSSSTTSVFDSNQSLYVSGSQSAFGAAITNGVSETSGSSDVNPDCNHMYVPSGGSAVEMLSNDFAGTISPNNVVNAQSESDLWASCGTYYSFGSTDARDCGSRNIPADTGTHSSFPPGWQNGGTLSGTGGPNETVAGDTNTSQAFCPPSQAAVNAGLGLCSDVMSTQSSSEAYSWNYSRDYYFYNGQPVPQTPTATLSASSALQGTSVSVSGGSNWWGNATGAPVTGSSTTQTGSYYTIPSPGVYIGTSRATAVAASSSNVSISATTYSCGQASSSSSPDPCTFTPGTVSGSFTVPSNLAPGTYNVYIDETNTSPFMGNGPNDSYQTFRGTSYGTAESSTQLVVTSAPVITSANITTFTAGSAGNFTVTTTGSPTPALSESGALPSGVTFHDNGNGTATLAGTPAAGTGGTYAMTITANNGTGANANQSFTLTVDAAPTITSANSTTFTTGSSGSFGVSTTGYPAPALSEGGALPSGVTFTDNGNGTATLSGAPSAGTAGSYAITITASNGVGTNATQSFTLTVDQAPAITSANSATFTAGSAGTFTVHTTGSPTPSIDESGTLPTGVAFTDNGNGTATLSGTPAAGTGGTYPITVTASNGVTPNATQSFTLTVDAAPAITSASSATFIVGSAANFTVQTSGYPAATVSETGSLPSGVSFTNNGDGTATLSGTPEVGTAGSYPVTITASNGVGTNATQSFTLTVDVAPTITSANSALFTVGSAGSFTVQATGNPLPNLSETGTLPSGVTFANNGNGTATISGTPASGSNGNYPLSFTADNGVAPNATQSFTLTVGIAPAITSASSATFVAGSSGTFTVQASGSPTPAINESGSLPSGVTFADNGNGTATLSGTPGAGTAGSYPITITASNGTASDATQSFTLTVDAAPSITSASSTTFTVGSAGTFTVDSTGNPTSSLSQTGSLPSGVTFTDNGNGTATLSGTPAAGTGGSYPITITASNGVGSNATQSFTLTVDQAPAITSSNSTTFTAGSAGTFTVHTSGYPTASINESGALPSGVTFTDNGNGTGTLSGTPAAGTGGSYPITITASNGVGSNATQSFTLTVDQAPAITSANSTTFTVGSPGAFAVQATGYPTPGLSETGSLPSGITFTDNGNGTATLAGTPASGTGGSYALTITASTGVGSNATQSFTLTVDQAPAITSSNSTTFTVGSSGTFAVAASGTPIPSIDKTGALPSGVTFVDNGDGTATLSGTPAAGTAGSYPITITASNGVGSNATQSFTLTVDQAPAITSSNSATFTISSAGTFAVQATGSPTPGLSETGALPSGVTFTDNGNGAATLGGTPSAGTAGSYPMTITASNGVAPNASQSFTLTVVIPTAPPAITSGNSATFTAGTAGSFTVHTTGNPTPSISESGTLPSGVTFVDNGDGTATLGGTASGTGGTDHITITASNGVGTNATQSFTLTVDAAPVITSANNTTFTAGSPGSFTVQTTGYPAPAIDESGTLPAGLSFVDNGDGTATLSGTPGGGTAGSYPITITASNGIGSAASQAYTLAVDSAPSITSAGGDTFVVGTAGTFKVTTSGDPSPSLAETGALPPGVTFTDNGDGTATLAGTPAAGTAGSYPITITASNGVGSNATQSFTLTVDQAPAITSAASATFTVGSAGSFTVQTSGTPTAAIVETGALPSGVTFVDNGDGTAALAGTPAAGTAGSYPMTITASNGIGSGATQSFSLMVSSPPSITSGDAATFTVGSAGTFTIQATGNPTPSLSESGTLPSGVAFHDNGDGTATISGTPASGAGSHALTITASNGVGSNATQSFTLTVDSAPAITSAASATFTVGSAGSFTVHTTGYPTPAVSETGTLPSGLVFHDNGDGTAALAGTPAAGTGGTYPMTITASNGVGSNATQSFTLTVDQAPAITSAVSATFVQGSPGSFTVQATGVPAPALSESGPLPSGVAFTDNGDGTATLAGTPAAGTAGNYAITITASNGVGSNAAQSFSLIVDSAPAITSASSTTFSEGVQGTFTVHSTGAPTPSLNEIGPLPSGVTFTDNGDGTATISGSASAGTTGSYPIEISATNGVGAGTSQSFTLTVVARLTFTSASAVTFSEASPSTFTVRVSGSPAPALSETGSLPPGVFFIDNGNGTATIEGTAPIGSGGTYVLQITASNGVAADATQLFQLTVSASGGGSGFHIVTTSLPNGEVGIKYKNFLFAAGGNPKYKWALSSGFLPSGLKLSHRGIISGKPKVTGTANFVVQVTDHKSKTHVPQTRTQALSITITNLAVGGASAVTPTPAVTSISPNSGPTNGGESVTVKGYDLRGATSVVFGSNAARIVSVNSKGTKIVAVTPAASSPETVDVTVVTPHGTTSAGSVGHYLYVVESSSRTSSQGVTKAPATAATTTTTKPAVTTTSSPNSTAHVQRQKRTK